ncbi:uncharacterized protein LOC130688841 isoform X2 [Daphnia carinata]|uniref:uncharacterized protein LOC130688841 isoform X2 n=1 Tax=Daphnia carinata TaxID=120202 RepID=UPI00257D01B7|nr:uncharacterized protein LOC130688841 isoform X2 [Daphnia carinata]
MIVWSLPKFVSKIGTHSPEKKCISCSIQVIAINWFHFNAQYYIGDVHNMGTFHSMNFMVWILVVHLPHLVNAAATSHECRLDSDCPESSFCDQLHFVCEICLPCQSLLNRAAGVDTCAKSEDDCGRCLRGFQSEDLTGQRRSYKCFPILDKQAEFLPHPSSLMTWNEFITLAAAIMLLAAMLVVLTTYYVKNRYSMPRENANTGTRKRSSTEVDYLPPPYNEVVSSDQTYTFATEESSEEMNQATPIGRYHMIHREDETNREDLDLVEDLHSEEESTLGSTETIPSSWEPSGTTNNLDGITVLSQQHPRIVRSQSSTTFKMLREFSSRSCPNLSSSISTGIHGERHVLLSSFRRPVMITGPGKQQNEGYRFQLNDPLRQCPLSNNQIRQPQEIISVNNEHIALQTFSVPEDTPAMQASESMDPSDPLVRFSRRRAHVDENPVNAKRRHME